MQPKTAINPTVKVVLFNFGVNHFRELLIQLNGHFGGCSLCSCWTALCYIEGLFLIFCPPHPTINARNLCLSVRLSLCPSIISTTAHPIDVTLVVLLRTWGSAVSSVKLFGWVVLQKAASSNTNRRPSNRPVPNRHVSNGHCTSLYQFHFFLLRLQKMLYLKNKLDI